MEVQTLRKPIDSLLEKVLCMNILSSDYFKELYKLKTYHEVIDEIYNQVDHVEPWMTGNCRGRISLLAIYVADPKTLWGWFEHYVKDDEEFAPGSNGRLTTMGVYVRDLLLGQSISLVHGLIVRDFEVGLVYWLAKVPQLMSEFWFFGTVRILTILKS
ncbi:hypothetical protein IFM89_010662 [Coptis chinensis]|uniref:Pre-mRNA-splicing factor 38 n=1 Tax=Coptis chinensis TaxID=261450 RepID=A0A835HGF1_9MAGN|nr:hypothetical protein IFM89_010662 [Coptis chinensis]